MCRSGKMCYSTRSKAKRGLKAVTRGNREHGNTKNVGLHIEMCHRCGQWHLVAKSVGKIDVV